MGPSYFWDQVSPVLLMGTGNREGTGTPQNEHRLICNKSKVEIHREEGRGGGSGTNCFMRKVKDEKMGSSLQRQSWDTMNMHTHTQKDGISKFHLRKTSTGMKEQ